MTNINKLAVHLTTACVMCLAGIVLIFSGFWTHPEGEIHQSVLVAFGEVVTFAGALFGVDYSYRVRTHTTDDKNGGGV